MKQEDSDATQIKRHAWRQGSVLPAALAEILCKNEFLPWELSENELLIVISHDCDVTCSNFNIEPQVELLRATLGPKSQKHGHYFWAKNPRTYQLAFVTPGSSPFEANSLKQIRHKPKSLIYALFRPHLRQRLIFLVLYLGFFFDFTIKDFFAIIAPLFQKLFLIV